MYLLRKAFLFAMASAAFSQTTVIDLRTQSKAIDFTNATATRPAKSGAALPATCQLAELFFNTNAPAGSNLFACTATNTWTLQAGGGGGAVSSIFGRAGTVVAGTGDYTAAQVTNAVDSTGSYVNPGWLTALSATKLTGFVPVGNGGTGTATPALVAGTNVTISGSWPNQTINSTGSAGSVSSVFGRAGAVAAAAGDYTAAQVTNAVDSTGSYSNPGWLTALSAAKLTGFVPVGNGGTGTATPALVAGTNVTISGNWPNQTINSTGGAGSAPTNFPVSRSGTTTLSAGDSCSTATPCNVRFGNTVYSFQNSSNVTIASGAGMAFIYISNSGILTVGHSMSVTCSAGCVSQAGVSAFPTDSIPLYSWSSTGGVWDPAGGIDFRASLSGKNFVCGSGLLCSESAGLTTAALDPTAIPAGGGGSVTNLNGLAGMATSTCTLTGYCSDASGRVSQNLTKPVVYYFHLAAPMTFNTIAFHIIAGCTNCALRIAILKASDLSILFDTGAMSDALVAGADLTTPGLKKSPSTLTTLPAGDYALTWATNSNTLSWYGSATSNYYLSNPFWVSSSLSLGTAGVFSGSTTGSGASFAFPGSFGTVVGDLDEMVPHFLFVR